MIPADFIAEWRAHARWSTDEQVEQDLVLCRALVEIFDDAELAVSVALRGGTALHKLHFVAGTPLLGGHRPRPDARRDPSARRSIDSARSSITGSACPGGSEAKAFGSSTASSRRSRPWSG